MIPITATRIKPVLLKSLGDGRWHGMDSLIHRVGRKMDVPTRSMKYVYKPLLSAKSMLKKQGYLEVKYFGGPVRITPAGKKELLKNPDVTLPTAVWIATATLHRDHGADELFTPEEIVDKVDNKRVYNKQSLQTTISSVCVANTSAYSTNHRMLYRVKPGKYRLYHNGDDYHKSRKGGITCPRAKDIPSKYKDLVKWYKEIYNKRRMGDGQVIKKLLLKPESQTLEFKSSLRYDKRTHQINHDLEFDMAKTLAGFLNSRGGDLLIGVDDHRGRLGLYDDFSTFGNRHHPADVFQQHITNIIDKYLGTGAHAYISIEMVQVDGKDLCHCIAQKSTEPVYLNNGDAQYFFIRAGSTTKRLNIEDAVKYIRVSFVFGHHSGKKARGRETPLRQSRRWNLE